MPKRSQKQCRKDAGKWCSEEMECVRHVADEREARFQKLGRQNKKLS